MRTPTGNKIHQEKIEEKFGANADLLQKKLEEVNWKSLIRYYFVALGIFLISFFAVLAVYRLAIKI